MKTLNAPTVHWRAPSLHHLFTYWWQRRGPGGLPAMSEFNLLDLPHSLANTQVLELADAAGLAASGRSATEADLVFSHIGSNIVLRHRRDLTGRPLSELSTGNPVRAPFIAAVLEAVGTRLAVLTTLPAIGTPLPEIDLLVLPLADAQGHVARVLVGSQPVGRPVVMPHPQP